MFGKLVANILRFLFAWIDAIIVKLITTVYRLFSDLSELVLYSDNIIKLIGKRISLLLGIFMLFKLAVSLINYMISPDKLNDSAKGGGRLIINVGVSLALLISINLIFKEAYKVQGIVVNSRIIEKIFFGNNGIVSDDSTKMDIGYYLYSGFFTPNVDVFEHSCDEMWDVSKPLNELTDLQKENNDKKVCDDLLFDKLGDNEYKSIYKARNTMDMSYVFNDYELVLNTPSERTFAFDYTPIISNAAGIIVLLIMISFSMDLATRAVKLLFLQIVAPIPIIANMDMDKGQEIFKKWYKECINTYLTVFIRLITINFAVFMIVLLRGNYKDLFVNNIWLNIFLIIGCLMFAKQVPKLLEDFFGIKMDGMALNPLKKFQEQALFGKQITSLANAAVSGAVGIGAGAIGGAVASGALGNKWYQNLGAGLRGAGRGLVGGIGAGYKASNPLAAIGTGIGRYGTNADYVNSLDGTTFGGRFAAGIQQRLHISTAADVTKKELEALNGFHTAAEAAFARAKSEMVKDDTLMANGISMQQHKEMKERLEILRSGGPTVADYTDANGNFDRAAYEAAVRSHSTDVANLQKEILDNEKEFEKAWIDRNRNIDGELKVSINQMEEYKREIDKFKDPRISVSVADADSIKTSKQDTLVRKQQIESEFNSEGVNIYQQQQANAAATKPKGRQ